MHAHASSITRRSRDFARRLDMEAGAGSLALFAARASAALVSFLANVYLAGILGAHEFGTYSLALALLTFSSLFMDFGYFASGARLLVSTGSDDLRRGYIGAMILIGAAVSMMFIGIVGGLAFVVDYIYPERLGSMLLGIAGLAPAMIAPFVIDQVLKATGRMELLAAWQTMPKVVFFAAVAVIGALQGLSAGTAIALFLSSGLLVAVPVVILVRPSWSGSGIRLREIAAEQRRFGRPLYIGKLANLASYNTDRLLLGFFRDAQAVGHYSLAMSFGAPVAMFAQSVAASGFTEFAHRQPISGRLLRWNTLGTILMCLVALAVGYLSVFLYLGPAYAPVAVILVFALFATACQAGYQPYNSWLLANGLGLELKRFLLVVAAINVVANVTLIPVMGAVGAALASGLGMASYLVFAAAIYRRQVLQGDAV
jgi:O-antigen/teichoic acid export membrane protein